MTSLLTAIRFCYAVRPEPAPDAPAGENDDASPGSGGWARWIAPLGLAGGVAAALAIAVSWPPLDLSHGVGGLWMAVVPMLLIYWLGPGSARLIGWAWTLANLRLGRRINPAARDGYPGLEAMALTVLALAVAVVVQYVAAATLPLAGGESPLPRWIGRLLFPRRFYGAIVLMGLWGNCSILLAGSMGAAAAHADRRVRQLIASSRAGKLLWGLAFPAVVSMVLFSGWWPGGWASALAMAVLLFGLVMLVGWLLARIGQGHCRWSLLACGLIGEIASLLLFHALVR